VDIRDRFLLDRRHPVVGNHTVYGRHVLPGLAYIDFLYQCFSAHGHEPFELELRNLRIYRPLTVGVKGALVELCAVAESDDAWRLEVTAQDAGAARGGVVRCASAEMRRLSRPFFTETVSLMDIERDAALIVPLDEVYRAYRRHGVVHSAFMQADGVVYLSDSAIVSHLQAGNGSGEPQSRLFFHPTTLDSLALCVGAQFLREGRGGGDLALPIACRAFRASAAVADSCIARIWMRSITRTADIGSFDVELFGPSGQKHAEISGVACKVVRDFTLIRDGEDHETSPSAAGARVPAATATVPPAAAGQPGVLSHELEPLLQRLIAQALQRPTTEIGLDQGYYELGLTSALLLELVGTIERTLRLELPPTLLFEYTTVAALADHLAGVRQNVIVPAEPADARRADVPHEPIESSASTSSREPGSGRHDAHSPVDRNDADGIAIIGMAGRFPQAQDVRQYWENLRHQTDCVTEVPVSRWDHREYSPGASGPRAASRGKWGGFIDGVDEFDALFFNIAPRDAELMDPQQRLFLETVWTLLEDAGYTRKRLRERFGGSVGVYVGTMYQEYARNGGRDSTTVSSFGAIANRVSYWFGFTGPSIAIDAMCASSLTAIHIACKDLASRECRLAIAGGVNLSLHPSKYVGLSELQLLGSDPDRRSFSDGDGFLPSEAVGAFLLKPLADAIADGDRILAVIRAGASNHSGRSSGYTVPDVGAQARLIEECLTKGGVDARTISYVEAAATGKSLVDAVEVAALTKAFGRFTPERQFCAIGSAKGNIGHAEAASGVTQLMKVVLQLQHAAIVPPIKTAPLNPHIDFAATPFFVPGDVSAWTRPVVKNGESDEECPRRALVNSFGAGGSNVTLLVEECIRPAAEGGPSPAELAPQIVVFSARDPERLQELVRCHLDCITLDESLSLSSIACTLQCGREAMESRVAMVVSDRAELIRAMHAFVNQSVSSVEPAAAIYAGDATDDNGAIRALCSGSAGRAIVKLMIAGRDLHKLARMWAHGVDVPWDTLYSDSKVPVAPLPTYPFERQRYWLHGGVAGGPAASTHDAASTPIQGADVPDVTRSAAARRIVRKTRIEPPRTEFERAIVEVWEDVLGLSGIGIRDAFLNLGGSSITGGQIIVRLRERFGVEVPVHALVGPEATVAALAVEIVSQLARSQDITAVQEHLSAVAHS
jgi:3-oxoacyl-(acyl-carrier-protein) synthase/acyl carrier protein